MTESNDIRKGVSIEFGDGEFRTIRPLSLKQLRKFVSIVERLGSTEDAARISDSDIDTMVEAAGIILSKSYPDIADDKELLEDAVDLDSFNKMMSVAMGNLPQED